MNLRTLSLEEFLRHAYTQINDLTSTDLEKEFLKRLEDLTENDAVTEVLKAEFSGEEIRGLAEALQEFDVEDVTKIIDVLTKASTYDPQELEAQLKLAKDFQEVANDIGDTFDLLNKLISKTQE